MEEVDSSIQTTPMINSGIGEKKPQVDFIKNAAVGTVDEDADHSLFNITHSLDPTLAEAASKTSMPTATEMAEQDAKEKELRDKVESANTWTKIKAMKTEASENLLIDRLAKSYAITYARENIFRKDDKYFMGGQATLSYIDDNNLPPASFTLINSTESHAELDFITNMIKDEQYLDRVLAEVITPSQIRGSAMVGAVTTEFVAAVATGGLTAGLSIGGLVVAETVVEGTLISANAVLTDNYRIEDLATETVGIAAAVGTSIVVAKTINMPVLKRKAKGMAKTSEEDASKAKKLYTDQVDAAKPTKAKEPIKTTKSKEPKITKAMRQSNAESYVASNTLHYNIPRAKHGVRTKTTQIIAHRTAGSGFHPHDTRLTEEGLGAHYTITYDGKIHQVNNEGDKMWHAGTENGNSVGVEVVGKFNDDTQSWEKMTAEQKISLDALTRKLSKQYGISGSSIKAHIEVGKKTVGEGLQAKLYMQKILGEQPQRTQKRLADLETEALANPSLKGKYYASNEVDNLYIKKGRQQDKANDVKESNSIDTQQRPVRSTVHNKNRKKIFEDDIDKNVKISTVAYDDAIEALSKASTDTDIAKANKNIDLAMDDMYRATYDNVNARTMRIVDNMANDVEITKMELEDFYNSDPKGFVQSLDDLKKSEPKLYNELESMINTSMSKEDINKFINKNATKGKFNQKAATAFAVLFGGSTIASAGNGEDLDDFLTYGGMIIGFSLAAIFMPKMATAIRSGGSRRTFQRTTKKMSDIMDSATDFVSKDEVRRRRVRNIVADNMEINFLSTTKQFVEGGVKTENLISDLAFNVERGGGAIMDKTGWSHSTVSKYSIAEEAAWKEWKKENGISAMKGWMDERVSIHSFREQMSDSYEMKRLMPGEYDKLPQSIKNLSDQYNPIKKEVYDKATEYEALGFVDRVDGKGDTIKGIEHQDNKLPRLWDGSSMNVLINSADDIEVAKGAISDALGKAIAKGIGDPVAAKRISDQMVETWTSNSGLTKGGIQDRTDDIYHAIEHLLESGANAAELGDALATKGSRSARTMSRIKFEALDIKDITIDINGVPTVIGRNQMLDRNFKSILDRTSNVIYGQASLAKNGYKSPQALESAITDSVKGLPNGRDLADKLRDIANYVKGNPIGEGDTFVSNLLAMAKDLLIVDKLALVSYSMPVEFFATMGAAGYMKGARSFLRLMSGKLGKDTNIQQSIAMSGLATNYSRLDISGFRSSIDNLDDSAVVSKLRNGTLRMREMSLIGNGLPYLTDILQKTGIDVNTGKLARFLNDGDETITGIQRDRLIQFGLDDETIRMFSGTFEMLDNGRVKAYDSSKWSAKKRDKFGEIIRNMNQQTSPETYIGTTSLSTHTDSLGKSASTLLTYPMMQYNTQGINGVRHMDRTTLMQGVSAFMGSYIGISARMEVQGKEVSDEDLLLYATLGMPQLGALSVIKGFTDPAFFSLMRDMYNALAPAQLETR